MNAGALATPVILTFNEEPNIGRTLKALDWAEEVVVVDSGSSDGTERVARSFANVRWVTGSFDSHAAKWMFGVQAAGTRTPYVLALDADYQVPSSFVQELVDQFAPGRYAGGIAGFHYAIDGRKLSGSVYPSKIVIFQPTLAKILQRGHNPEVTVDGPLYHFKARLVHDDRKPLARFVSSQMEYARLESLRLAQDSSLRWQDRLRTYGVMPVVAGLAAYFRSGGPLKGSASLRYAYERTLFECLLALQLFSSGNDREKP